MQQQYLSHQTKNIWLINLFLLVATLFLYVVYIGKHGSPFTVQSQEIQENPLERFTHAFYTSTKKLPDQ